MNFIDLTKKESVSVSLLDEQHKLLAEIVNILHDSLLKKDVDSIKINLNKLIEHIEIHFESEEKLMKEKKSDGYFSHKLEHDRFYNQLVQTVDEFNRSSVGINEERLESIKKWFFNHIEIKDKKCGAFLNSIGIN